VPVRRSIPGSGCRASLERSSSQFDRTRPVQRQDRRLRQEPHQLLWRLWFWSARTPDLRHEGEVVQGAEQAAIPGSAERDLRQASSRIAAVRDQLKNGRPTHNLTAVAKAKWTKVLDYNWHDCNGMREVAIRAAIGLANAGLQDEEVALPGPWQMPERLCVCDALNCHSGKTLSRSDSER
jgi:hypothetical protein